MTAHMKDGKNAETFREANASLAWSVLAKLVGSGVVVPAEEAPSAWLHPEAGWAHTDFAEVAMHCRKDGLRPIPLFRSLPASAMTLDTSALDLLTSKIVNQIGVMDSAASPLTPTGEMTREILTECLGFFEPGHPIVRNQMPIVTPADRLLHAIMSLRTEHGDRLNADDATELFEAISGVLQE